ncbi:MAG: metal ABC transporter permease [Planctomycetota bacterium]
MTPFWETFLNVRVEFLATLLIAAVTAYLGLFTLLRRIVFTGVALAQMAAAGVAAAFFVEAKGPLWLAELSETYGRTAGSLGGSLLGVLALEAPRDGRKIATDAVVGALYAAAAGLAVLLVWGSAQGLEELKHLVAGDVLLSRHRELVALWTGLPLVALVHLKWRRQFLLVSYDPEFARALGLPERRYQLALLSTLAVAIALALFAGGLLLVFAFLVLPGMAALRLGRDLDEASWLAPVVALGAALLGFAGATACDLPVAPAVSAALVLLLALAWAASLREASAAAARAALGGLAALALVLGLGSQVAPRPAPVLLPPEPAPSAPATPVPDEHGHEHDHSQGPAAERQHQGQGYEHWARLLEEGERGEVRRDAVQHLEDLADPRALQPLLVALDDEAEAVRAAARHAIACLVADARVRARLAELAHGADPGLRALAGLGRVASGERQGVGDLVGLLGDEAVPVYLRARALAALREINRGQDLGLDLEGSDAAARQRGVAAWRAWWEQQGSRLHWEAREGRFRATP